MTPEPWWMSIAVSLAVIGYWMIGMIIASRLGMDDDSLLARLFVTIWPVALLAALWAMLVHAVICRPLDWAWRRALGWEVTPADCRCKCRLCRGGE